MAKVKDFFLGLVCDFFVYWLPAFVVGCLLQYVDIGFTANQCDFFTGVVFILTLWNYWNGKDTEEKLKELENEIAVLKGESEVM